MSRSRVQVPLSAFNIKRCIFAYIYFTGCYFSYRNSINGSYFWEKGFVKLDPINWFYNFKINFDFFFQPDTMLLFILILFITGIFYTIKRKDTISRLFIYILFTAITVSFLKLYPLIERTALYLLPILILICTLPLNMISKTRKMYSSVMIIAFILSFSGYNLNYLKTFFDKDIFTHEDPRTTMEIIKNTYDPQDILAYNIASDSEYLFYTRYYNFHHQNFVCVNTTGLDRFTTYNALNLLPKNKIYVFYFPFEYEKTAVINILKEWGRDKNIIFEKEIHGSYILKIQL